MVAGVVVKGVVAAFGQNDLTGLVEGIWGQGYVHVLTKVQPCLSLQALLCQSSE